MPSDLVGRLDAAADAEVAAWHASMGLPFPNTGKARDLVDLLREAASALRAGAEPVDAWKGVATEAFTNIKRSCIRGRNVANMETDRNFVATCDHIENLADEGIAAATGYTRPQPATPASGGVVVRHNDDGTLDEVVGVGEFHLEQMDSNKWWMQLGPHMVTLTSRKKIRAWFGENEAQLPTPPASKGGE